MRARGEGLMAILRVGGRGQVTLPVGIREALGITEGRKMVCYVTEGGDIVLHPLPAPRSIEEVAGALTGKVGRSLTEALERAAGDYAEAWRESQPKPHADAVWREAAPARDAS
ncbi:AbrB/MazE/SpoVT family DNA-binding domain-containing protein [Thermaerobacter subterraneus]|uniref:Looped-hinge helix DNA binding domain, AbrB family n=1 Tax=Thermaerobacter subterraneus DSM 13965 TaxID=867903 RepID=K6PZV5_9FIRM|nr:looped-hinge helix DNA binding domain, AbrB family [Thermaerobacter subterraneus DSM 13965]